MTQKSSKVEVNIISASVVRDYARCQLPSDGRDLVEQTMLDDERARDLVVAEAPSATSQSLSNEVKEELCTCIDLCERSVVDYEALSRSDASATIANFAANRFAARWKLLAELKRMALSEQSTDLLVGNLATQTLSERASRAPAVRDLVQRDGELEERLMSAFEAPATPAWKAKIAEWISNIQADRGQIFWLNSAIA